MRIATNIFVILLAAFGAFWLIAPWSSSSAYTLLAPANADVLFPYDSSTIFPLVVGVWVTGAHVLFLSAVILWFPRWLTWKEYAYRCILFLTALIASVGIFVALGFVYRHFSANNEMRVYGRDLPVVSFLFAVFIATVSFTLYIRFYHARKTKPIA